MKLEKRFIYLEVFSCPYCQNTYTEGDARTLCKKHISNFHSKTALPLNHSIAFDKNIKEWKLIP